MAGVMRANAGIAAGPVAAEPSVLQRLVRAFGLRFPRTRVDVDTLATCLQRPEIQAIQPSALAA